MLQDTPSIVSPCSFSFLTYMLYPVPLPFEVLLCLAQGQPREVRKDFGVGDRRRLRRVFGIR